MVGTPQEGALKARTRPARSSRGGLAEVCEASPRRLQLRRSWQTPSSVSFDREGLWL